MSRKWLRFIAVFSAILLSFSACLAEQDDLAVPQEEKGMIRGKPNGLKNDIFYRCLQTGSQDFVLLGLEGSGMNPWREGIGISWNKELQDYNVIDFSIAGELSEWDDKKRETSCENYASAIVRVFRERFRHVRAVGVFVFSKGACGADSVFRKLKEEGCLIAFVWLADPFIIRELSSVMQAVENREIFLYNRHSKKDRLNDYGELIEKTYGDLPNVDTRFVSVSHGGLLVYDTFMEEMTGAVRKAIAETDPMAFLVTDEDVPEPDAFP